MGSTALRQLLKSLCTNYGWNYAVFWKLRHQYPKFLSWEDGYIDHPKHRTGTENLSDMLYFDGPSYTPFCDEPNLLYGCANQYDIGRLVADMSCQQYAIGEGLVGKAARTGNDCWIYPDYIPATNQFKLSEFPDEWISLFWAGIKTVLLVPVLPHGVLQLGSVEVVGENAAISDRMKERYYSYRIVSGTSSFSASKNNDPSDASLNVIASFMEESDDPSTVICNSLEKPLSEVSESEYSSNSNACHMLAFDPPLPLPNVLVDAVANNDSVSFLGLPVEFFRTNHPSASTQLDVLQNNQFSAYGLGEDLSGFSKYTDFGLTDKFYPRIGQFHDTRNVTAGTCKNEEVGAVEMGFENISSLFSFHGPALNAEIHGFMEDEYLCIEDLPSISCFTNNQDFHLIDSQELFDSMEQSTLDFEDFHVRDGARDLLEAAICNMYGSVVDCSPNSCEDLKPVVTTSDVEFIASAKVPTESEAAVEFDRSVPQSNTGKSLTYMGGTSSTKTSIPATSKSVSTTLSDKVQQDGCPTERAKDVKNKLNGRKRKGRAGDGQKPRPRDRQLIQDRVKELRELVPNSSKCSIDALLDRTIKHMGFLRGVTNQAERLRNFLPPKEIKPKIWRTLGIEDDHQRGKSHIFDFGSEFQVYPIVVEDLDECPGHLLIEMLCDEQGEFLEIAQVIGRLELTILKGSIETRADNKWAHFIVEAYPGFKKTDIFWPLMQVLQRQGNPISTCV